MSTLFETESREMYIAEYPRNEKDRVITWGREGDLKSIITQLSTFKSSRMGTISETWKRSR